MLNKYINYKYKTKLRYKQPDLVWYLSFSFIGIGCLLFIKYFNNFSIKVNLSFKFPTYFYLFIILILIFLNLFLLYKSPFSFSKMQRIRSKLLQIIEQNHFYYELDGKIRSSMEMIFYELNDELYIEVYPLGGKFTNKIDEIGKLFETKLNMTLITIQNDYSDHTTYILSKNIDLTIDSTDYWS